LRCFTDSAIDQDLSIQKVALTSAGCAIIREEKVSGTSTEGREELATLLRFVREGDALVVTRIECLARSLRWPCPAPRQH
jgi:DNA invertase Pin-like site-specific DNA recombinase